MDYYDKVVKACGGVAANVAETVRPGFDSIAEFASSAIGRLPVAASSPPPPPEPWLRKSNKVAVVCGISVLGAFVYFMFSKRPTKRICGARSADGGRQDVVLVIGSTNEPLVRLMVQELNLRSFIVYVCSIPGTPDQFIDQLHCTDVRPLPVDVMSPQSIADACQQMSQILNTPVTTVKGGEPYYLRLAGILVVPDLSYPEGPLEMIPQVDLESCIASKIVSPLYTLRSGVIDLARRHNSRIILLNPSIIANLSPPYHLLESISAAALDNMALTIYRELRPQNVPFSQIKLGSFDVGADFSGHRRQVINRMRADIQTWPENERHIYAGSYLESSYLQTNRAKGSSMNCLYSVLAFTLTTTTPPRVVHVGRYSYTYEWLRNHIPECILTWALS